MIHPSFSPRSDSRSREILARVHLQGMTENDWGISIFPCLAKLFNWRTFAKPSVFVTLLSLIGCTQGILEFYFRNTALIWGKQYHFSKETMDILLYLREIFVALIALPLTYYAISTHLIISTSSMIMLHGIVGVYLFVPEIFFANLHNFFNPSRVQLCGNATVVKFPIGKTDYGTLVIIAIYQLLSAASYIAFFTLGLVYIDPNRLEKKYVLAIAIASRELGVLVGMYASWVPIFLATQHIFNNYIWQSANVLYIILGVMIAMFPKTIPYVDMRKIAASLLESARGNSSNDLDEPPPDGFFKITRKMLTHKITLFSILSAVAFQSAVINFLDFEDNFKQAKFFIQDDFDTFGYAVDFNWDSAANYVSQPFIVLCMLFAGFAIVSRVRIKYLVLWNLLAFLAAGLSFNAHLFVECDHDDITTLIPACSVDCGCSLEGTFNPVCLNGKTYYSPCHAGCNIRENVTDADQLYTNCTCGFLGAALKGSCREHNCNKFYRFTQLCNIIAGGFMSTTVVTNIVIVLKSVKREDRSMALALELTFLNLIAKLPLRLLYSFMADKYCKYQHRGKCAVHSQKFAVFLTNVTIFLLVFGLISQMYLLLNDLDEVYDESEFNPSETRGSRHNSSNREDNAPPTEMIEMVELTPIVQQNQDDPVLESHF